MNISTHNNTDFYMCCSGFCIDLLKKFSTDLGFSYRLTQVADKKWGTIEVGKKWGTIEVGKMWGPIEVSEKWEAIEMGKGLYTALPSW